MPPISPGVYTKIIDLSEYVQTVPSTIGFIAMISERGPDNKLVLTNARDFYLDFGEPNINYMGSLGKQYGLGPYVSSSFLKQSDTLYVIRVLPTSDLIVNNQSVTPADYANLVFAANEKLIDITSQTGAIYALSTIPDNVVITDLTADSTNAIFSYEDMIVALQYKIDTTNSVLYIDDLVELANPDNVITSVDADSTITYQIVSAVDGTQSYAGTCAVDETDYTVSDTTIVANTSVSYSATDHVLIIDSTAYRLDPQAVVTVEDKTATIAFSGGSITRTFGSGELLTGKGNLSDLSSAELKNALRSFYEYYYSEVVSEGTDMCEVRSVSGLSSASEIDSVLGFGSLDLADDTNYFTRNSDGTGEYTGLFAIFGVGRGEWYNNFRIKISPHTIPMKALEGVYILEIEQKQKAQDYDPVTKSWIDVYEVVQTYEVSFNPNRVDESGDSMFLVDVINRYFRYLKADVKGEGDTEEGIKELLAQLDTAIVNAKLRFSITDVYVEETDTSYSFDFSDVFDLWTRDAFVGFEQLRGGSDGDIKNADVAKALLARAYSGTLKKAFKETGDPAWTNPTYVDEVLDTDNMYFNLVFDAGYPKEVKDAIVSLCSNIRRDCLAILDNGDNRTTAEALDTRLNKHTYNTFYAALYECYTKIYDMYTGKDIWVTPVYHMANIIPYTENVSELWYAPAGFNRATIDTIKSMRFSPRQGERDQFYLNQINPIVKFNVGFTVWGQLTTQKRPTALQNINIVRLLLYIKRALEQFCKFYIFELNDETTWNAVKSNIDLFLSEIKNKRGLYDYSVEVGATEYEIKKKVMHVNVTLNPTRVVEQIHLNFFIV